ncbi:efflux RND transporter periplasmic adaptor subunit [Hyphobacterium sp. CCMP332]|nr:efflux RND transporter periplasmic adaptor subunit [Hyphobacterium sp. CCMP332]
MDRKIEKKKWPPKKIAIWLGSALLVLFIAYNLIIADGSRKLNIDKERISISEVSFGDYIDYIPIDGTIQPIRTVTLDAIEGGRVEKKYTIGGTSIKEGDTILKLTNHNMMMSFLEQETRASDLINNLQSTRLSLQQNRFRLKRSLNDINYNLARAEDIYMRNKELYEEKVLSEQEFLQSKWDYERLKKQRMIEIESQRIDSINMVAQINQLERTLSQTMRNLEFNRENLSNLLIIAPISGLISSIDQEVGESVDPGQNIGQIDDINSFKVRALIDEHYVSRVFPGLKGYFDFAGARHELEITRVYPEVTNGQFRVDMKFVKDYPEQIRRGQTTQIRLELSDPTKALLIPRGGFFQQTGGNWIFVFDESSNEAVKRKIRTGRQNSRYYEVLDGLIEGEKVIVSSYEGYDNIDKLVIKE